MRTCSLTLVIALISSTIAQAQTEVDVICAQAALGEVTQQEVEDFLIEVGTLRGDANLSGNVDFADFLTSATIFPGFSFGSGGATWSTWDFNCDGTRTFSDFLWMSTNFGLDANDERAIRYVDGEAFDPSQIANLQTTAASVPEPQSAAIAWIVSLSLIHI